MKFSNEDEVVTYSYDSKGQLSKVVDDGDIYDFTWDGNNITCYNQEWNEIGSVFTLSNNMISSVEDGGSVYTYTYNSSKQISCIYYDDGDKYEYTWENGKLTRVTENDDYVYNIIYSGKTCKGYFPLIAELAADDPGIYLLLSAHPELAGIRSNQLPDMIETDEGTQRYSYTLDEEGYLKSCTVTGGYDTEGTYTFQWK